MIDLLYIAVCAVVLAPVAAFLYVAHRRNRGRRIIAVLAEAQRISHDRMARRHAGDVIVMRRNHGHSAR